MEISIGMSDDWKIRCKESMHTFWIEDAKDVHTCVMIVVQLVVGMEGVKGRQRCAQSENMSEALE